MPARRIVSVVVAQLAILLCAASASAAEQNVTRTVSTQNVVVKAPQAPRSIAAESAVVLDLQDGRELWSKAPAKRHLIASTTKIMTALVAIERTRPNQLMRTTAYRGDAAESLAGFQPGELVSAQDLIRALMLLSGNDAADTLAARTADSRADFVAAMNTKARALGLRNTHFANAIGLDAKDNYSTASDLAALGRHALGVRRLADVVRREHAVLRSGDHVRKIDNLNPLIGRHAWAIGIKTGHTLAAGYLLVGAAEKRDAQFVSVVTGEPTEADRLRDSTALLEHGRAFYRSLRPLSRSRAVAALKVRYTKDSVPVRPAENVALAARDGQRVVVRMTAPDEIEGPRQRGEEIGSVVVLRDEAVIREVPLLLAAAVAEPPTAAVLLHQLSRLLPWLALLALLFLLAGIFMRRRENQRRRPGSVG